MSEWMILLTDQHNAPASMFTKYQKKQEKTKIMRKGKNSQKLKSTKTSHRICNKIRNVSKLGNKLGQSL